MLHVFIATLLIMVATFLVGLATAWLIRVVADVLYYAEHRSLKQDVKTRVRLMHLQDIRRKRIMRQLVSSSLFDTDMFDFSNSKEYKHKTSYSPESELIKFFYGNN
ncbi:MAG: hypothetical protein LBK47_04625 [Prevotellaceae bacterium]|jgi:hypothetical protein|nr:hypothetical protein [Prevotellaceae bacterium]